MLCRHPENFMVTDSDHISSIVTDFGDCISLSIAVLLKYHSMAGSCCEEILKPGFVRWCGGAV